MDLRAMLEDLILNASDEEIRRCYRAIFEPDEREEEVPGGDGGPGGPST